VPAQSWRKETVATAGQTAARLGRMYAERGFNGKINHVIATALLEIEIANGNHNEPQDEANDKAGNH
jgi:hypothetical protein